MTDSREIALRWIEDGWQKGRSDIVDRLHAEAFVDHAADGRLANNEGFRRGIDTLYAAFPDFYAVTEDLIVDAESSRVAIRWVATGTHRGEFLGVPATGRKIEFAGIEIITIRDGRITERWGEWDGLSLLNQLKGA